MSEGCLGSIPVIDQTHLSLVYCLILDYLGLKKVSTLFKNETFLLRVYTFLGVITPIFKSVSRKQRNIGEV